MELSTPQLDLAVVPELRAFIAVLSHLPVDLQIGVLKDATAQIVEVVEQSI